MSEEFERDGRKWGEKRAMSKSVVAESVCLLSRLKKMAARLVIFLVLSYSYNKCANAHTHTHTLTPHKLTHTFQLRRDFGGLLIEQGEKKKKTEKGGEWMVRGESACK